MSIDKIRPLNINKKTDNLSVKKHHTYEDRNEEDNENSHFKSEYVLNFKTINGSNVKSSQDGNISIESTLPGVNIKKQQVYNIPLSIEEKVVCLSDSKTERDVGKCLGLVKNSLIKGTESDNAVGLGSDTLNSKQLFEATYLNASLMPPESLIKLSNFEMNNSKEYNCQQKTTNNNNYNNLRSNNQYCSWKHKIEDKTKVLKINSLQNSNFSTNSGELFQVKNFNEDHSERELVCNRNCKADYSFCISQMHYPSRSFDSSRSSDRKIGNNRQSKSMDNDLPHNKEPLANIENSMNTMEKFPSSDLVDFSHGWTDRCEFHNNMYVSDPHHGIPDFNMRMLKEQYDYPHTIKKKHNGEFVYLFIYLLQIFRCVFLLNIFSLNITSLLLQLYFDFLKGSEEFKTWSISLVL